ncbi:MAG TPA: SprT-like domain-containing protein [Fimbriimonas sp.]|nr:SprT-like domain-containing protein [Fimbriimonas sp.]
MFLRRRATTQLKRALPTADEGLHRDALQILDEVQSRFPLKGAAQLEWRRYRVTAGMAHYQSRLITLSVHVLKDTEQLRSTLLHEYAHLLAYDRHGRKGMGHGELWKRAMLDLGQPPKVYHQYEVQRNSPKRKHVYACARCGEKIERHRRLASKRRYYHRSCGGPIKFIETQAVIELEKSS